ncbi:MAG: hypothetical protein ACKO1L_04620 [Brachymonas sp.]
MLFWQPLHTQLLQNNEISGCIQRSLGARIRMDVSVQIGAGQRNNQTARAVPIMPIGNTAGATPRM